MAAVGGRTVHESVLTCKAGAPQKHQSNPLSPAVFSDIPRNSFDVAEKKNHPPGHIKIATTF